MTFQIKHRTDVYFKNLAERLEFVEATVLAANEFGTAKPSGDDKVVLTERQVWKTGKDAGLGTGYFTLRKADTDAREAFEALPAADKPQTVEMDSQLAYALNRVRRAANNIVEGNGIGSGSLDATVPSAVFSSYMLNKESIEDRSPVRRSELKDTYIAKHLQSLADDSRQAFAAFFDDYQGAIEPWGADDTTYLTAQERSDITTSLRAYRAAKQAFDVAFAEAGPVMHELAIELQDSKFGTEPQ